MRLLRRLPAALCALSLLLTVPACSSDGNRATTDTPTGADSGAMDTPDAAGATPPDSTGGMNGAPGETQ